MKKLISIFSVVISLVLMSCSGGIGSSGSYDSCAMKFVENSIAVNIELEKALAKQKKGTMFDIEGYDKSVKSNMETLAEISCLDGELVTAENERIFKIDLSKILSKLEKAREFKIIRSAEVIDGNSAIVELGLLKSDGSSLPDKHLLLINVDGVWKVEVEALRNNFIPNDVMNEFNAKTAQ